MVPFHQNTRSAKHLPPSADIKNEWSYTPAPPTCLHDVGRDKLIFYLTSTSALTKHRSIMTETQFARRKITCSF